MNKNEKFTLAGNAGLMEGQIDYPKNDTPVGVALVAHPHPLYGGTMDNKVAVTLARTFASLGYEGVHDHGHGETDDMAILHAWMTEKYPGLPVALGGFSFGTFVQSKLAQRLVAAGTPAERLVLVGSAAKKWEMADIPADTILIHGENDDTIPLIDVLDWLRPQEIPVIVIPGADHFFHRKLQHIKSWVTQLWRRPSDVADTETDTAAAD
jgi:alpha/beta superfamily hydrolase